MESWHRFYDPSTGRYISADPIGIKGGLNLYAYVQNNPVNWMDPNGLILIIVVPPSTGNQKVDPITEQIINDWHKKSKVCRECQHPEIDWKCVWNTVDLLTGGALGPYSNQIRATIGMAGGIDLIVEYLAGSSIGAGPIITTWGASITYGAILGCTKCVPNGT